MTTANGTPASKNGSERRRFPRRNIALDVAFAPVGVERRPPESQLQHTVTVDLSIGGMCLYTDVLYPVGTQLFCLVTVPNQEKPIELTVTVAWFQRVSQEVRGYKLGLEFAVVSAVDRAVLERVVLEPPAQAATRSKTVLLVDDDFEFIEAMKVRFQSAGYQVLTASEGLEALEKGRTERPHLIILDLMLPKLNGYDVCRLLKFDQKFQHIPIIVLSARARQEDRDLGYSVGADAYVTKPFDGKALLSTVETVLAKPPHSN